MAIVVQPYPGYVISIGDSGNAVTEIQTYLNAIAETYPSIGTVTVDGRFGSATKAAVERFQAIANLRVDGEVGDLTWNAFDEFLTGTTPLPNVCARFAGILRQGSSGRAVSNVQFYLSIARQLYPNIPAINVDGRFGPATKAAVQYFQGLAGLTQDGIVGPQTWAAACNYLSQLPARIACPAYPGSIYRVGSTGNAVRYIQYILGVVSKKYPSIGAVTIDGVYGQGTRAAVIAAQRLAGVTQDGIVGPNTWQQLCSYFGFRPTV